MVTVKVFIQEINSYLDGDKECNGVIVPNKFNIYKSECNNVIAKMGNKSIVLTEKILQDFTIVGSYVWDVLASQRKYLYYSIIGYIAQNIKYNSNIIRLTPERLRGYIGSEIANRDYYNAINYLKNYSIIADCDIKGCFTVNPIAIFKGSIYKFVELCEDNGMSEAHINNKDTLLIDKALVIKDKMASKVEILLNKKYYKEVNIRKELSYSFDKRIN